ncbi:SDR family oxidoreductase [Mucilaginibacter sp. UR6-1]|uniref:NAD-dependent epimerase/dehydratase family protein n=1 Tax=Mucilaginibacter sp. UR6-1 TaxID=1435643 RepID=UPI001E2A4E90|nr:SDR family oxidoreductase [Mucilaginibacter sp. UR6-1]MCC8408165.1 SDR family oxidoreductase [Mucilaginibacter sp. UR6-1]
MKHNKTILITGASGFLGTWLADEAAQQGYKLIGIDMRAPLRPALWEGFATSSLESVDLDQLLKGHELDAVCHLAGGASVAASVNDPYGDFSSLLPGTARLALYIAKAQRKAKMLFFSSAAVYGNPKTLPITEQTPVMPISPYGIHKATAETLLMNYSRALGIQVVIFRIFSVYGPGLRKQLIYDVTQRAIQAATLGQKSIQLFGTGAESRDFMYVQDVCRAVTSIIGQDQDEKCSIYNLASGIESTVADVARCLISSLNIDMDITFDGKVPPGDPVNWRADVSKLDDIGFSSVYSLSEGLNEVAQWAKVIV